MILVSMARYDFRERISNVSYIISVTLSVNCAKLSVTFTFLSSPKTNFRLDSG